jgi:uncharacterized protein YuzE
MSRQIQKISYDKESGVLSIEVKKARSVDSDIRGNVVIDYDKNGDVVRINFYDFNFRSFQNGARALKKFARNSVFTR